MSHELVAPTDSQTPPAPRSATAAERIGERVADAANAVARGAANAARQRPKDALKWFSVVTIIGLLLAFIWASFFSPFAQRQTAASSAPMNVQQFRDAFRDVFDARDAKVIPATDPTLMNLTRGVENLAGEVRAMKAEAATERNEIRKEIRDQNSRIDRVLELVTKPQR